MTELRKLSEYEASAHLAEVPGWSIRDGKLHRAIEFRDFVEAFGFMAQVALVAERMDHHPEWSNVYQKVRIDLVTHSVGGVSALDLKLAATLEELASRLAAR